jgi:hypothetical protein
MSDDDSDDAHNHWFNATLQPMKRSPYPPYSGGTYSQVASSFQRNYQGSRKDKTKEYVKLMAHCGLKV